MVELLADVLLDSLKDTAELLPFLFATYLAMEALEHASGGAAEHLVARAGIAGPAVGACLGAVPQCGFSAMAATLYAGRVITVGTLVAVILSTSDELVPVFLAEGAAGQLWSLLLFKVVVGLVVGFVVDLVMPAANGGRRHPTRIHELCERAHCHCSTIETIDDASPTDDDGHHAPHHHHGHGADAGTRGRWYHVVRSAAVHTAQVTVFILVITFAFGLLIEGVGEDALGAFLGAHPVRATFLAGLVGLIPNCGASVVIAELYLAGSLAAGPMVAGLLASGGVGLLVLFRTNANLLQNVKITAFVYAVGVVCGLVVGASGIVF